MQSLKSENKLKQNLTVHQVDYSQGAAIQVTLKQIIGLYMPGGIYPKDERMVTSKHAHIHI